jgi:hypothetical protein
MPKAVQQGVVKIRYANEIRWFGFESSMKYSDSAFDREDAVCIVLSVSSRIETR